MHNYFHEGFCLHFNVLIISICFPQQLILAQSTSQCCRVGICQPSLNWVVREAENFNGGNPHDEPNVSWIHEESSWIMRCMFPPCRETKYVQHSSTIPEAVQKEEDYNWCRLVYYVSIVYNCVHLCEFCH